jgi:hypothetical protein
MACSDFELAAMDEYSNIFKTRHRKAVEELTRLQDLLQDVNWYSFETKARTWREPWHESDLCSEVVLHGKRYTIKRRGTREREKGEFPIYYEGPVGTAPELPPVVVMCEVKHALELVKELEEACVAPYEWAPGGRLYEKHVRESTGATMYRALSSNV